MTEKVHIVSWRVAFRRIGNRHGGVAFAALFWLIQTSHHEKIEVELDVKLRSNWI